MGILRRISNYSISWYQTFCSVKGARQQSSILLALVMIFLVNAACTNISSTSSLQHNKELNSRNCRIIDEGVRQICIPLQPQSIATLWVGTLGNALALGVKPAASVFMAGEPIGEYIKGKVDGITSLGSLPEPNLEKLLLIKPDLILSNSRLSGIYEQLSRIAPTITVNLPVPPVPIHQQLRELARLLNREEVGERLISDYWQRINQLKQGLGDRREQLEISVASADSVYGVWAYGEKSPVGSVLNDAGFHRPPAQRGDFYYIDGLSEEDLSVIDGDVLFLLRWGKENNSKVIEKLKQKPLWNRLKAVQSNQVYIVDAAHWHGQDILAMNAVIDDLFRYLLK